MMSKYVRATAQTVALVVVLLLAGNLPVAAQDDTEPHGAIQPASLLPIVIRNGSPSSVTGSSIYPALIDLSVMTAAQAAIVHTVCMQALSSSGLVASDVSATAGEICLLNGEVYPVLVATDAGVTASVALGGISNGEQAGWSSGSDTPITQPQLVHPQTLVFLEGGEYNAANGPAGTDSDAVVIKLTVDLDDWAEDTVATGAVIPAEIPVEVSQIAPLTEFVWAFKRFVENERVSIRLPADWPFYLQNGQGFKRASECGVTNYVDTNVIGPVVLWPRFMVRVRHQGYNPAGQSIEQCMYPYEWIQVSSVLYSPVFALMRQDMRNEGYRWEVSPMNWWQPSPEAVYAFTTTTIGGVTVYTLIRSTAEGVVTAVTLLLYVPSEMLECVGQWEYCEIDPNL